MIINFTMNGVKMEKKNRRESKEGECAKDGNLEKDEKTTIVEYPIEQQLESELRYYRTKKNRNINVY